MPKTSFKYVIGVRVPVIPKSGKDGVKQSPYDRRPRTVATSSRLLKYRGCIARGRAGQKFNGRVASQNQFKELAKKCSSEVM